MQFCITGLRYSSPKEYKMHQNSWRPRGFASDLTGVVYSSSTKPQPVSPFPKTRVPWLSPSGFEIQPFGPRLAPPC